jgi:hypothetical protein
VQYDSNGAVVPKRNTSGVPEWNEAEINAVLELWNKRERQSEWKSISLELAALNSTGELNSELAAKGLQRTNNAVMNKVKELSGIARARRSRPRTVGNFALLPFEQCKSASVPAPVQWGVGDAGNVPQAEGVRGLGIVGPDSSERLCSRAGAEIGSLGQAHEASGSLMGTNSMSVVSPVPALCPPPVLLQAQEHCMMPAVPHVSPVQNAGMHSSPVVQQDAPE